jgi:hypothetical protein
MRRWMVLGIAVLAGCGAGAAGPDPSPVDGFWRSLEHRWDHELTLSSGRYEAGDRDPAGICRVTGVFIVEGTAVELHQERGTCAGSPDALQVAGDQLLFGSRTYVRADPAAHEMDIPIR